MDHLPIFMEVRGKRTLLVGDGVMAARKADWLLRAGSNLTIVTPNLGDELLRLQEQFGFTHQATPLQQDNLSDCVLAFGCAKNANKLASLLNILFAIASFT